MSLEQAIKNYYNPTPQLTPVERSTMTSKEVAEYLGLSQDFVFKLVRKKQIPYMRIGRRILFKKLSIDNWLKELEYNPEEPNM